MSVHHEPPPGIVSVLRAFGTASRAQRAAIESGDVSQLDALLAEKAHLLDVLAGYDLATAGEQDPSLAGIAEDALASEREAEIALREAQEQLREQLTAARAGRRAQRAFVRGSRPRPLSQAYLLDRKG